MRMTPTTYGAFLSTLSLRRATGKLPKPLTDCVFLSTLSLRRATLTTVLHWYHISISIHALLAESDQDHQVNISPERPFLSTLSLRRATGTVSAQDRPKEFLSTLSLRRATLHCNTPNVLRHYFYPRSPCGERLFSIFLPIRVALFLSTLSLRRATVEEVSGDTWQRDFYPRSPCGERRSLTIIICIALRFLSTLSLRRATRFAD